MLLVIKFKKNTKNRYKSNVKHIFRYYSDLIVSSENKPNLKDLKVIKITNLEGLVNVAEQTKNNIIYYELIKNQVSNLYVIVNEYVYIYTITDKKYKSSMRFLPY